jgi:hypothetical protein
LVTVVGVDLLNSHIRKNIRRRLSKKPIKGERIKPIKTFSTPFIMIIPVPDVATAAPTMPDSMAWLDDVGRPKYHVTRSQTMAATRAEIIVICVIHATCTRPAPTILATAVPDNAPTIFSTAAIDTATLGDKTLVETEVAIALAESWKPFMKSNATARAMTTRSK